MEQEEITRWENFSNRVELTCAEGASGEKTVYFRSGKISRRIEEGFLSPQAVRSVSLSQVVAESGEWIATHAKALRDSGKFELAADIESFCAGAGNASCKAALAASAALPKASAAPTPRASGPQQDAEEPATTAHSAMAPKPAKIPYEVPRRLDQGPRERTPPEPENRAYAGQEAQVTIGGQNPARPEEPQSLDHGLAMGASAEIAHSGALTVEQRDCRPSDSYNRGRKVVSLGCSIIVELTRGEAEGRYQEIVLRISNTGSTPFLIDGAILRIGTQSTHELLSYEQVLDRHEEEARGKRAGEFIAGLIGAWSAAQTPNSKSYQGDFSGTIDGRRFRGKYSGTYFDNSERQRRIDRNAERFSASVEEIDLAERKALSDTDDNYLRPHTLRPGESAVRFVTIKSMDRRTGFARLSLVVSTPEGQFRVEL